MNCKHIAAKAGYNEMLNKPHSKVTVVMVGLHRHNLFLLLLLLLLLATMRC